jgi:SAM-dependent methyltransferase
MTPFETFKRVATHATVLGTYWPDYRDAWLKPTRDDGVPDRVLDAGCGRGATRAEFKRFGIPVDYYGVDLGVGDPTWEFRVSAVADLHGLPFRSASFDKIICNQVLEHVDHPDVVLAELARVVRPGGRIFLSVPFIWHLHQEPYDRFRFSLHALEFMLKEHGLVADLIQPMGGYFSVLRYMLAFHSLVTDSWPPLLRAAARPLSWAARNIDSYVGGPLAFALDQLDRDRKLTLGYTLHISRPASAVGVEG